MQTKQGFTLIELLVVIVIIGILVAIALPNYIRVKKLAKEAEAKNNLHSIQLAIERYATDSEGTYPPFLYGGDPVFSQGVNGEYRDNGAIWLALLAQKDSERHVFDYYDEIYNQRGSWDNEEFIEETNLPTNDTIVFNGYLEKYPANPFAGTNAEKWYGKAAAEAGIPSLAGWGGKDGSHMFNLGLPGEMPLLANFPQPGDPNGIRLDFPGSFYYHPRFRDNGTMMEHSQVVHEFRENFGSHGSPLLDFWPPFLCGGGGLDFGTIQNNSCNLSTRFTENMATHDVNGYDLALFGAATRGNQDIDWSYGSNYSSGQHSEIHGSLNTGRSGYFVRSDQRNPWGVDSESGEYDYSIWTETDGIPDFVATVLSSGVDSKIGETGA